jgi:DNA polymerase III subunit gamma/tau
LVTPAKPVTTVAANPTPIKQPVATPKPNLISTGNKKGLLDALREKYGDQYAIEEVKEAEVLKMEKLQSCWDSYTKVLEQQLKHSSAGTFKIAKLAIEDDIHFTVTISSLTSQKFVEQERMMLIDHLQKAFNNRTIAFTVLVDAGEMEEVPAHLRMNSRQKYERIAEQYPLVKALKEKLKLEIDY